MTKIAAIQASPVYFDKAASTAKAVELIREAAEGGAQIAAFGETWIPGYPFFAMMPPMDLWYEAAAAYAKNAVVIGDECTQALCQAAKDNGIDIVIGIAEREPANGRSVYCTLLFIGREGEILGRHRKIKPTAYERSVWADGDASGLRSYDRPYGRISGLNCWEHQMGLPGFVLATQAVDVHVAVWPGAELPASASPNCSQTRQLLLSRAFAAQASAYVICVGGLGRFSDMPEEFRSLQAFEASGDSYIIDPRGEIVRGPAEGEQILFAELDRKLISAAKAVFDAGGHYSRPDIFQLNVKRTAPSHVSYDE